MAIAYLRYKMWLIHLCVFVFTSVLSSSEYYGYDTELSETSEPVAIVFHDGHYYHKIHKRNSKEYNSHILDVITEAKNAEKDKIDTHKKLSQQTSEIAKVNSSLLSNRNLGVNGTGQRKDYLTPSSTEATSITNISTTLTTIATTTPTTTIATTTPTTIATTTPTTTPTSTTESVAKKEETINGIQPTLEVIGGEDDIALTHHNDEIVNQTAITNNVTIQNDTHHYYNSTLTVDPVVAKKYWVNFSDHKNVHVHKLLSASHRVASTVRLSFDFPFYGHIVRNVTIATGGFLYTGEYVHSWLAATQYIAPLMANFDTRLSDDSLIKYVDSGKSFTVQWERVRLQNHPEEGEFTFQATLHENGNVVFVYKDVPVSVDSVVAEKHPIKIGLSDAYIIDRTVFLVRRKTIYEYHRVSFSHDSIKNWTLIYLSALPTCLSNKDCETCLTKATSKFNCTWCPSTGRCSNGMDRNRQDWLVKRCEQYQIRNASKCSEASSDFEKKKWSVINDHHDTERSDDPKHESITTNFNENNRHDNASSIGVPGVITILFIIGLMSAIGMWVLYAYRNPHSASGQMLIRYRLTQWSWTRGEARYTAATIHM